MNFCSGNGENNMKTTVTIAGAGPGDPELLTLKTLRRLQDADVVLHDSLISREILALFPEGTEAINVGKRCDDGDKKRKRVLKHV